MCDHARRGALDDERRRINGRGAVTGRGRPWRVVLVGAGHTHVQLLRALQGGERLSCRDHELVLVAPGDFWYSGLAPGVLAGQYPPALGRIDVENLARGAGATLIRDRAMSGSPAARTLELERGGALRWDVLSVNVGSRSSGGLSSAGATPTVPVKPIPHLLEIPMLLRRQAEQGLRMRVVIAGGGASGCEVALVITRRAEREGTALDLSLVSGGRILEGAPAGAARTLRRVLRGRGVEVMEGTRVERVAGNTAVLASGATRRADVVVDATGLAPPALVERLGLPRGPDGGLLVDRCLRSVADAHVFAVGDCASFRPRPLPRVGVYAVRQAGVLRANLGAVLDGEQLHPFRPQRRYLLILNLGDGTGLAVRGRLHVRARWVFRLKDRLDRRFLEGRAD